MNNNIHGEFLIESENDITMARKVVREAAVDIGFGITDVTRIVTAASELTRNIYHYAKCGKMRWRSINKDGDVGIELTFEDNGPGIPDIDKAMEMGFSSGNGLGLGLPGAKRLMDKLSIESVVGKGTMVIVQKWLRQ